MQHLSGGSTHAVPLTRGARVCWCRGLERSAQARASRAAHRKEVKQNAYKARTTPLVLKTGTLLKESFKYKLSMPRVMLVKYKLLNNR